MLKSLSYGIKGYTVQVSMSLLGRRPIYYATCVVRSRRGMEEAGMRYDVDKEIFLDSPFAELANKPGISREEDNDFRLDISKKYSAFVNSGFIDIEEV
jgi:hypothetical protein